MVCFEMVKDETSCWFINVEKFIFIPHAVGDGGRDLVVLSEVGIELCNWLVLSCWTAVQVSPEVLATLAEVLDLVAPCCR